MRILRSYLDVRSDTYRAIRAAMDEQLARYHSLVVHAVDGGG